MKYRVAAIIVWSVNVGLAQATEHDFSPARQTKLPLTSKTLLNPAPYIPPQCYTKTKDDKGGVHNPCFTCHTAPQRPNYTNDLDLQFGYDFPEDLETNYWKNLFKDRRQEVEAISDAEIQQYVRTSNYFDNQGQIKLNHLVNSVPREWDYNKNGEWEGFIPDAWFAFDEDGFDRNPDGGYTGWRAFAYYPFPGTFWPTNGSTDDVLIRLPEAFRQDAQGRLNLDIYKINLAIVEAMLKEQDVPIEPADEIPLGVDLNRDGKLGKARKIVFDWAPLKDRHMEYVGKANELLRAGKLHIAAGLYPEGTEFLHTVRYIDVNDTGDNLLTPRIKELRYAKKRFWLNYSKLKQRADAEFKEKRDFPDRLRTVRGDMEHGVSDGQAWAYTGFIEDTNGELRPQNYEELVFCVGCHGGIGGNRDGVFSFGRKFGHDTFQHGWYHWTQKGLRGVPDRKLADGKHEYTRYLSANGAGDEFRANDEILQKFFDGQDKPDPDEIEQLQSDISQLLFASPQRVMNLNKAYRVIVKEQSFRFGRDATINPIGNVHKTIKSGTRTGITKPELTQ